MTFRWTAAFLLLAASACNSPEANDPLPKESRDSALENAASNSASTEIACPFRQLHDLRASISGGRLLVTGRVDFMMAGFRPQLSPRPGSTGTLALDLALVPEPQAAINDSLRYEQSRVPAVSRGEIWCGDERLTSFDIILVG